jgi:hypothetical protein
MMTTYAYHFGEVLRRMVEKGAHVQGLRYNFVGQGVSNMREIIAYDPDPRHPNRGEIDATCQGERVGVRANFLYHSAYYFEVVHDSEVKGRPRRLVGPSGTSWYFKMK